MNAKVLVVEDEEPLATLLQYNLEAEGFRVAIAIRGDEAEMAVSEDPPDLSSWIGCCRACPASSCAGDFGPAKYPGASQS